MSAARKLFWPGLVTGLALAVTLSLGVWQTQRLAWKEALIDKIAARSGQAARPLPLRSTWATLAPADYDFTPVTARGRFDTAREALVFSGPPPGLGDDPGWFVVSPFQLADGGVVLVDRGFIANSKRKTTARRQGATADVTITGSMRAPQSRNAFTPADAPDKGEFFTADPTAIAAALKATGAAPFMVTLAPDSAPAGVDLPHPVPGRPELPNNHFSYAVTWFSLALVVAVIFSLYARSVLKPK